MSTLTYQGHEVLFTRQQIAVRVAEMGAQITHDLNGEKLVMIGVLKGAAPFLSDLARAIQADATFDFVAVSSYGKGQRSSGAVKVIKDLDEPIEGKNVLIVEDILDTGLTLAYLRKLFLQQHPKTLRIATLLDKPSRRIEKIEADYVGFSIPNLFVIGYGMDYAERYRNLPDICPADHVGQFAEHVAYVVVTAFGGSMERNRPANWQACRRSHSNNNAPFQTPER
jgi:hypoxanthine phosphoribosyltransferase